MDAKYFCTHFDSNYLPHARALYDSLQSVSPNAKLFMFCMDDKAFKILSDLNLVNAILVPAYELENSIPNLKQAKENRTRVEYFYTCSPAICYYVLQEYDFVNVITYLDSDLYFFSSPAPIFTELGDASIGIIEHRFSFFTKRNKVYGNFNVGWITFRKNENGIKCLKDWMDNCIAWCYQKLEEKRYADQKYLDYWQKDYEGVHVIKNIGANMAIWNIGNYKLSMDNKDVLVDHQKLIFYHFANLKQVGPDEFKTNLSRVFKITTTLIKNQIYIPYLKNLHKYIDPQIHIVEKKDLHSKNIGDLLRSITRNVRGFFLPDTIKINQQND